jgi:hypothetical protein
VPNPELGRDLTPAHVSSWLDRNAIRLVVGLAVVGLALRVELAVFSPQPAGYFFDPYFEGVRICHELRRLPVSTECWQCYHPPLFYLLGWPLYSIGMGLGGQAAAHRWLAVLPFVCGCWCAVESVRILRFLGHRGRLLVLGAALVFAFPCLFISTYGAEADILLAAILVRFLFVLLRYDADPSPGLRSAVELGVWGGLAAATKYSGLIAAVVGAVLFAIRFVEGSDRRRAAKHLVMFSLLAALLGGWKYVDNVIRFGTPLFANGSANDGFAVGKKVWHWDRYEFGTLRVADMLALTRPGEVPPGPLTDVPAYRSVWTTLHAQAWGDMSFFSDPSRHGISLPLYPDRGVPPELAGAVLLLGFIADGLAILGLMLTAGRRANRVLTLALAVTLPVYFYWVLSQDTWALKTKYLLFLLPCYTAGVLAGLDWVRRVAPRVGYWPLLALLVTLLVLTHMYLHRFAVGAG